ncbi:hypothetical protein HYH02_010502 [Chlamydomonas schloesseri]|uniref:ABC transporter n=1 Tax=Chlamydomonas schloesseri TaxID=2026947 RepID=A0A835W441_9CHLO|nr:hypothetical protein HYH02_010502 [Chlamydomonas schloesseri]|eukprot:KAG2439872.1 hypothetical protein HYH02_010502 [Chlamydomonas schloesseri]
MPRRILRPLFLDTDSLIWLGYRTRLEPEHTYADPGLSTPALIGNLDSAWQEQLKQPKPDLKRALLRGNGSTLLLTGMLYTLARAASLAGPLLLRRIVTGLQCQAAAQHRQQGAAADMGCEPTSKLYFYIIGLFLAPAVQSLCDNQQTFLLYRLGTRMRNALMAAIYRKCLRLSSAALQEESVGKVVTLMSNDAQKLQDAVYDIHALWGGPICIIAILILLWFEVGWAMFVGLGVMLVMVPLTGMLVAKLGVLRRELIGWTDKRVGLMGEIINGMQWHGMSTSQMIKFYAWEDSFRAAVMAARDQEAQLLRRTALWQGLFQLLLFYGPVAVALFVFGSYSLAGQALTPARAYTALALFSLLRFPMSLLPMLVTMVVNALVAIKRIGDFLLRQEAALEPWDPAMTPAGTVRIRQGYFSWGAPAAPAAAAASAGACTASRSSRSSSDAGAADPRAVGAHGDCSDGDSHVALDATAALPTVKGAASAAATPSAVSASNLFDSSSDDGNDTPVISICVSATLGKGCDAGSRPVPSAAAAGAHATLTDIHLEARPGTLTMIVGGVGCGKSSLLSALIGHISRLSGGVEVGGRIAYVAQSAWIMNATLQENVLMGNPMDADRYRAALEAAQLGPDLAILPNGDLTEIGDRGVTLSGGQKQRVSIARAIYDNADVYLLDDPLSAVDSHVGRALFEQVIRGPVLRSKTVLLVTNALQYLPQADNVLWLEGGRVRAQGTFAQLQAQGLSIAEEAAADGDEKITRQALDASAEQGMHTPQAGLTSAALPGDSSQPCCKSACGSQPALLDRAITLTRQDGAAHRNLTGEEARESGAVSAAVLKRYLQAGGGWVCLAPLALCIVIEQAARVCTDKWLGSWFGDKYGESLGFYLGIYFMLGVVYGLATFVRSTNFLFFCVRSAVSLHNQLLSHMLALPKAFFDTNPAGRILNRFSRDTDIMDATLPQSLVQFVGALGNYLSVLVVIAIATKWFAIALPGLTIIYLLIQRYYIPTARELQRIESVSRSPIYSRFAEALAGLATIRAYRAEAHFTAASDVLMERNAHAFVTQQLAAGWLACRLDMLGLVVLTLCGVLVVQASIDPGMAGLALVYALDLTRFLKHGTNMASKSEADFNSVERIAQYLEPETEARPDTPPEVAAKMPQDWPEHGQVVVQDLQLRYRPEMPLVLRGISFTVEAGEKVGLVGRTGSGKSSLLLALFRMVEPAGGRILIDGVDICTLGLRHLRSRMSIIPQDPFMFNGTVRHNLDPFDTAQDHELWEAIDAVGLRPAIYAVGAASKSVDAAAAHRKPSTSSNGSGAECGGEVVVDVASQQRRALDAKVVDGGANFSLGQRQLFCLARAMLRKSRILMLDEATASVDVDTDSQIQGALRLQFGECTCLTIAHRLNTIMDADRVIVLEAGKVVENGEPAALLVKDEGAFTGMVAETGRAASRYLTQLARTASAVRAEVAAGGLPSSHALQRIQTLFHTRASFAARTALSGVPHVSSQGQLTQPVLEGA